MEKQVEGDFLPVENVQALAGKKLENIPRRYIRPETEHDSIFREEMTPVIDMSKLISDNEQEMNKLHLACRDLGFFQLINHGVLDEVIEKMKIDMAEFFNLPLEEKLVYGRKPNGIEGYGQASFVSDDEKLDWVDILLLVVQPVPARNMNIWPKSPSSFSETLQNYSKEMQKVTVSLIRFMSMNLGIDPEYLAGLFEAGRQSIRMNYYPQCAQANKVIGLSPHSDTTGLTILTQANDVEGLQIRKDGKWVPIKPLPNGLIIIVGDMIEILSNGEYQSIEHRAMVNPEKERLTVAAFHGVWGEVRPMPELVKAEKPKFRAVTQEEYVKMAMKHKLNGKSLLDRLKM